jgi:hypothetical protein
MSFSGGAERLFRVVVPAFLSSVKRPLILVGDFNAVDGPQDRLRLAGTTPSILVDHALVALVSSLELVDMWKALWPRDLGHTYTHQGDLLDSTGFTFPVHQFSSLNTLKPFLDPHCVLRVGGRIERLQIPNSLIRFSIFKNG